MPESRPKRTRAPRLPALPKRRDAVTPDRLRLVAIGASAGGLEACKELLKTVPEGCNAAFILVQHLDPNHDSFLVEILSGNTALVVEQAVDGKPIERGHLYVIPPGYFLSTSAGALHLSRPKAPHGSRLPFDFLLESMAPAYGSRGICVVLSGNGDDGSRGLCDVKAAHGLVIVQDPAEAAYVGMPKNAIATGVVDAILPVSKMMAAIFQKRPESAEREVSLPSSADVSAGLAELITVLKERTGHDFALYKPGTLERRIERRMVLGNIPTTDVDRYIKVLQNDKAEAQLLANDLLINVTSFFRDPTVFTYLAEHVIPELIEKHSGDAPIRIWIAGCSTGEETYSLAILFREAIATANRAIELRIFASDLDAEAVKSARDGLYPHRIEDQVSQERLDTFFSRTNEGYLVNHELRKSIVFTVQDVLCDPPFSRVDFISCRNLLIYLGHEAQTKVLAIFHFALRDGGILLLGNSETIVHPDSRFEIISKKERLFRRVGRNRPGDVGFLLRNDIESLHNGSARKGATTSRQPSLADVCRQAVLDAYAPASILVNRRLESVFSMGAIDRYLQVAPGPASLDVLAMASPSLRTKLRAAIQKVVHDLAPVTVSAHRTSLDSRGPGFRVDIRPVVVDGDELLLISFVDDPKPAISPDGTARQNATGTAELELELDATRIELQDAIRDLELVSEEQKAINEEALSVNEEYQSTNEELVTSKEELQSLNEELTALNSQLQETLDRQRTTSDDLQNVLYSTDLATIFLDADLNIRFFTPATKLLFNVIATDVGRPLADLRSLAADNLLSADARSVLKEPTPIDREIQTELGLWFLRKILPYRTHDGQVEGVVITFTDVTERKRAAKALEAAKLQAETATVAKSRFLAAASHDLRQPLQTLALLQDLLKRVVKEEAPRKLIARLDQTLGAMSSMLNTLLDINQIEAGAVQPEFIAFPINDILRGLAEEFAYHAESHNLEFKVVPSRIIVYSDPRLLEQMMRNLLANAFKYTKTGKVLLGCRRHEDFLSVQIWDTGIGISQTDLQAIFEEYHQLDNPSRDRAQGLGLGLSIVKRLSQLMHHRIEVRSSAGHGSGFLIDVPLPSNDSPRGSVVSAAKVTAPLPHITGAILIIEDEPEVGEMLQQLLLVKGHAVSRASSGEAALDLVVKGTFVPDIILADFNLPNGMDGLRSSVKIRSLLRSNIPVVILTGDISTSTLHDISRADCTVLNKPVKPDDMGRVIQHQLNLLKSRAPDAKSPDSKVKRGPTIYVVDDDSHVRQGIRQLLEEDGQVVEDFGSCQAFLDAYHPGQEACLLIDAYLPEMSGIELLEHLNAVGHALPSIMITGNSDVPMAVHAMRAGASNFIEKPIGREALLDAVKQALEESRDSNKIIDWRKAAADHVASLTPRQREIMQLVLAGHPSKNIASDLNISQRTVENHRASIMKKTGSHSLPALARLALAATWTSDASQAVADPAVVKRARTVLPNQE